MSVDEEDVGDRETEGAREDEDLFLRKHKEQGWKLQDGGKGTKRLDAKNEMAEAESLKRCHFAIVAGPDS